MPVELDSLADWWHLLPVHVCGLDWVKGDPIGFSLEGPAYNIANFFHTLALG